MKVLCNATTSLPAAATITSTTTAAAIDPRTTAVASTSAIASTSSTNATLTPAIASCSGRKRNLLALKKMAYKTTEDDEFKDEEGYIGSMGHIKFSKRSENGNSAIDSSIEIINGSFSNLRPIVETSRGRAQSTPRQRMEILSGNTSFQTPTAPTQNLVSINQSTKLINNFVEKLCSQEIELGVEESDETQLGSIRDRVEEVFAENKAKNLQKLRLMEENERAMVNGITLLTTRLGVLRRKIRRVRENVDQYDDFFNIFMERMPSKFCCLQIFIISHSNS